MPRPQATTKRKPLSQLQVGLKHGFRSGLEERNALELAAAGVVFKYEKHKVGYTKPARDCTYTPDFVITTHPNGMQREKPLIIETKGRFETADRQKHLLVKRQNPTLDIRFVFNNPNAKISKTSKTTYADWCNKHGYLFAKDSVPLAWLTE